MRPQMVSVARPSPEISMVIERNQSDSINECCTHHSRELKGRIYTVHHHVDCQLVKSTEHVKDRIVDRHGNKAFWPQRYAVRPEMSKNRQTEINCIKNGHETLQHSDRNRIKLFCLYGWEAHGEFVGFQR